MLQCSQNSSELLCLLLETSQRNLIMKVIGIIPARLASTRLPRKLLLDETGKTLLQHTWEAVREAESLGRLIIATDDEEIEAVAKSFGAEVVMTGDCSNGTERVAEAIENLNLSADIIVNIQGDEPEIDPQQIDLCVQSLSDHPECEMSTLANPLHDAAHVNDPACVKVVRADNGNALYFSRSPLPCSRDGSPEDWFTNATGNRESPWLQHIGLYAYREPFLKSFVNMPASTLENIEKLEQLRALQAGAQIHVSVVSHGSIGIDTPEDYAAFVKRVV